MSLAGLFIAGTAHSAATASKMESHATGEKAGRASSQVRQLEREIDKLYMIIEALWLIIKKKNNLDDENLTELIAAIDLKDGHRDGKVATAEPRNCPKCGRVVSVRHMYCIYCGAFMAHDAFAR